MNVGRILRERGDLLIAVAISLVYVAEVLLEGDVRRRLLSAVAAVLFGASLAVRRRWPLVPMLAGLGVVLLDNTVLHGLAEAGAFLVGFIVALYSAGRYARGWMLVVCAAIVLGAIPEAAIEPGQPLGFSDVAFFTIFFGGPFVAGRIFRHRRERERELVEHATTLELEQETRAEEAVAEERGGSPASCTTSSRTRSA